eukprot:84814-Pyramimonas_sp.AAC.1
MPKPFKSPGGTNVSDIIASSLPMGFGSLKMAPRWPARSPRGAQEGPKKAEDGPKIAQEAPKSAPRGPQGAV